jgi:hypothetical protein
VPAPIVDGSGPKKARMPDKLPPLL